MSFPAQRLRRLRFSSAIRNLVAETLINPSSLVAPLFIVPGTNVSNEIKSLPGQFQLSADKASEKIKQFNDLGINAVILFGIPDSKDDTGSSACREDGVIQKAVSLFKKESPATTVITDLCFCEYTSHGHCGILKGEYLDNDQTLKMLVKQAVTHANAGADMIAPSGMLDGCVQALRSGLDEKNFINLPIMAYSAKYASAYYGPFREAVNSAPQFGDRKTYQMSPANINEAIREVALDIEEGADIVMVKPALAYLDVIRVIKDKFSYPTAAYNVSGEYAMIKFAAEKGLIDGNRVMLETLTSIKRAGADIILTYFAEDYARLYNDGRLNDF